MNFFIDQLDLGHYVWRKGVSTQSTDLKGLGILYRLLMLVVMLASIPAGLVFPPLWIGTLMLLVSIFRSTRKGRCPLCDEYLEVNKKKGGVQCPGCKSGLRIENNKLWTVR